MVLRISVGSLTIRVPVWNPLYAVAPTVLLVFSLPLAFFATITTAIAVTLMFLRGSVVLLQIMFAVGADFLLPTPPKRSLLEPDLPPKLEISPRGKRHVRSFCCSEPSSQEDMSSHVVSSRAPEVMETFPTPSSKSDMARDFEGVGGWRTAGDDEEEALWMNMNSRLELPAQANPRRHQRSLTGGGSPIQRQSHSPEASRRSPVQSRARTPVRFVIDETEGYFPPQPDSTLRPLSSVSEPSKRHSRRKSGSGSSSSSTISGLPPIVKESGP